jgi:Endonuclease-reverse transcriptase
MRNDNAPAGFSVCHVHRPPSAKHSSRDGLAIVHRSHIVVKAHPLAATVSPGSVEWQLVRITLTNLSITVCNAYRAPSQSIAQFHDELADVLTAVSASTVDRLLLCGDLNSPGTDAMSVRTELADVLDTFGLKQCVTAPTRYNPDHLLDVLAAARIDDAGFVSDHRLVLASNGLDTVRRHPLVVFSYRRIRDIKTIDFERRLPNSSLFTAPSSTAETFAEQIQHVIVGLLDELAPLRQCTGHPPKAVTSFLSAEAIESKRLRHRLERRWRQTHYCYY